MIQSFLNRIKNAFSRRVIQPLIMLYQAFAMKVLYLSHSKKLDVETGTTLFWVPGGMPLMLHVEGAIAAALKLRGNNVHAIVCDGTTVACVKREIGQNSNLEEWKNTCLDCKKSCSEVLNTLNIPHSFIGDYVKPEELQLARDKSNDAKWESIQQLEINGKNVGKNVHSSIVRYLKGIEKPSDAAIVREYAYTGLVNAIAAENALKFHDAHRVFMSHGCYVDWGPCLHTCTSKGIQVTSWMASYLSGKFYLRNITDGSKIDIHNIRNSTWKEVAHDRITESQEKELNSFLEDRYKKNISYDMKDFAKFEGESDVLRSRFGLQNSKPIWGILTHINWDSVSDYSPMVYTTFNEWILETISIIKDIIDVEWIIKIHPAEAWDSHPDTGIDALIKRVHPKLPSHIKVFAAEENISPLDFFHLVDGCVTVYGTPGLEASMLGKPVILAGEAHYGMKGFTYDSGSISAYREHLQRAPSTGRLSEDQLNLAKKYGHLYFIQRQIPLKIVHEPNSKWWKFQHQKRNLLIPGRDKDLDFVCKQLLTNGEYILDGN